MKEMLNKRFSRWRVLRFDKLFKRSAFWICECDCGVVRSVCGNSLRMLKSRSCGCLQKEVASRTAELNKTHGMTNTKEFRTWQGMIARCHNKNHPAYPHYGGRGISVCDSWRNSFESFYRDMGSPSCESLTIERVDNNDGYRAGNCVWATTSDQSNNKRNSRRIALNGQTKTMSQWSTFLGIKVSTIAMRFKYGWSTERALSK